MLLSLTPEQFEENNIIFSEKTKNTILANGDFYRIYYSDKNMSLNGIFINFKLKRVLIEPYFNKVKCTFDYNSNTVVINYLKNIEKKILGSLNNNNKNVYRIEEQLSNNFIKIFSELDQYKKNCDEVNILLKISGIWLILSVFNSL